MPSVISDLNGNYCIWSFLAFSERIKLQVKSLLCTCSEREMEVEHFSHPDHPLILINRVLKYSGDLVICSGCDEPIWGPCYSCTFCFFFLHKKCAELPREINRHIHSRHPLHLLAKPPSHYKKCVCDLCDKTCENFVYSCSICKFDLDIKCALPPCIFDVEDQEHQFICLAKSLPLKSVSFTCNACGTDGDDSPIMCTLCQLIVHKTCISFPRTIKTRLHQHPRIIHTYHLQQCNSRNKYCGICREGVDTEYGVYYCPDCDFVAHVKCGIKYRHPFNTASKEEEERSITLDDEFKESSFDIVREIDRGEEQIIAEIKHFSHQHNLILIDEINNDLKCDGCMLPIFTPCYSCGDCNFFLDKACIGLPRQKNRYTLRFSPCTQGKIYSSVVFVSDLVTGSATIAIIVVRLLTRDASNYQKNPLNIVVMSIAFTSPRSARIVVAVAVELVESLGNSGALVVTSTWILNVLLCQIKRDTAMMNILFPSLILIQMTTNLSVKYAKKKETQSSGSTVVKNATLMLIQSVLLGNIHL